VRILALIILGAAQSAADTVTLADGTFLRGRVERICDGVVEFRSASVGEALLRLPLSRVDSLSTDEPVMLAQGDVALRGIASISAGRALSSGGAQAFVPDDRLELWRLTAESAGPSPLHGWSYEAEFDLSGRSGPVSGSGLSAGGKAAFVDDETKLDLGLRVTLARSGTQDTADDLHAVVARERKLSEDIFWYMRADAGYDHARSLDFLSVAAIGYGRRLQSDARGSLSIRAGLGYRHEESALSAGSDVNALAGDLGLALERDLGWSRLRIALSLVPNLGHLADYYARNESSLEFLGKEGPLSLRVGLVQEYRPEQPAGLSHLDTAYFLKAVFRWK